MNILNNVFKRDHRYNKKISDIIPTDCVEQTRRATPIKVLSSTTKTKAVDNDKKRPVSSFRCQINHIFNQWQKVQEEKEQYQQKQQQLMQCINEKKRSQYDEVNRIVEENLVNQLQELERQEEKYYKQMEIILEEQLKQDNSSEELDDELERFAKQNDIHYKDFEKLKSHQKLYPTEQIQILSQQQQQQQQQQTLVNKLQLFKVNELIEETQHNLMNFNQWKSKQGTTNKTNLVNKNKMIDLLRRYAHTKKKYRIQTSK
ncbi:unnamed protein product [Adineta steineri]|uniref:Uncharacterized protein n=1 Tax=Adineta steineri TaxID=433720 RepID=A0A815B510_9BILA|nr:unnamed protein product [Adineta steineri]CAF3586634.1 unnamed protein product [Adineta steineri]